jgi:hypothetical protein
MTEKINYSLSFQVVGGTTVPVAGTIESEAYEKIQVNIPAGSTNLNVNLQPTGTKLAQFLLIKASKYSTDLSYKVNADTGTAIVLDGPHVFVGNGAVAILDTAPAKLLFSNKLTEDVTVDILLGRDATP